MCNIFYFLILMRMNNFFAALGNKYPMMDVNLLDFFRGFLFGNLWGYVEAGDCMVFE